MSRWVRGIYNAAANFVMSGSLRAARGRTMDRNTKHLHDESNQSGKRSKSNQSCESAQSDQYGGTCHRNRDSVCSNGDHCYVDKCGHGKQLNLHVDGCICSICREYNEYTSYTASVRTEGQGASSWIRFSDESRSFKQSDTVATRTNIEHITGIPTGTTI
jgi:hypothetical protein